MRRRALTLALSVAMSVASATQAADVENTVATVAAAPVADTPVCTDVLFLGVPGSAQGGIGTGTEALGATLTVVHTAFAERVESQGLSLTAATVPGQTEPVRTLWPSAQPRGRAVEQVTRARVKAWRGALGPRVETLVSAVHQAVSACPSQLVTVAGQAQGAMVVHRALLELAEEPAVAERVVAAALVADGEHTGRRIRTLGTPPATKGAGVASLLKWTAPPLTDLTAGPAVWHVCTADDIVCDINDTRLRAASRVHGGYASEAGAASLEAAAAKLWKSTSAWPVVQPKVAELTAEVGQQVALQLTALIRARYADDLTWVGGTGMPPGLRLTSAGLLKGVPTATGDFQLRYRVENGPHRTSAGTVEVSISGSTATGVTAGSTHSCEVAPNRTAWCWGENSFGQLGTGNNRSSAIKERVGSSDNWAQVSAGTNTTCAVRTSGTLWCWGLNHRGQVGDGSRTARNAPVRVGEGTDWRSVTVGGTHACGVRTDGSAWCWGANDAGQLGSGSTGLEKRPRRVSGDGTWQSVTAGGWHSCGVQTDGTAWCWGRNLFGEVGDGTVTRRLAPVRVDGRSSWTSLSASWMHTCGVVASGVARCWGANMRGQLGDGATAAQREPTRVAGDARFDHVVAADGFSCGVSLTQELLCWGSNRYGQFGSGTRRDSLVPTPSGFSEAWRSVAVGAWTTCGLLASGGTRCWGNNEFGQVGDGTTEDRRSPATPIV